MHNILQQNKHKEVETTVTEGVKSEVLTTYRTLEGHGFKSEFELTGNSR